MIMEGLEFSYKNIPSKKVKDLGRSLSPDIDLKIVGIRLFEKWYKIKINEEDLYFMRKNDYSIKIFP
jgi:hypothetical protein